MLLNALAISFILISPNPATAEDGIRLTHNQAASAISGEYVQTTEVHVNDVEDAQPPHSLPERADSGMNGLQVGPASPADDAALDQASPSSAPSSGHKKRWTAVNTAILIVIVALATVLLIKH